MTPKLPWFFTLNTQGWRMSSIARNNLHRLTLVDEVKANREYLLEFVHQYHCLFIGLNNLIDEDILARAKKLQCIVTPTTGVNHINMRIAEQKGVTILSLRGETEFLSSVSATAELAWALILVLIRKIVPACESVVAGNWAREHFYGQEAKGKTLGIIGFGRLGKMLGNYGQAFGMNVVAYDINPQPTLGIKFCNLHELLMQSDVISVNLPLTEATNGILGFTEFALIKRGAYFVNTARGEIIDEDALLHSLITGQLAGAAIDVMCGETSGNSEWLEKSKLHLYACDHDNLLISPHIGGATHESVAKTDLFVIEKLAAYLDRLV